MKHPFTCLVSRPTGGGKTSIVKAIFEQNVINPFPKNLKTLKPLYKCLKGREFHRGVPYDIEERFNPKEKTC